MTTQQLDCGHTGAGYGREPDGATVCYACIVNIDQDTMDTDGHSKRLPLYLVGNEVTNLTGCLRFRVAKISEGHHNIAGTRKDVWFRDRHGHRWHGTQYGHFTEIVHARRLKTS